MPNPLLGRHIQFLIKRHVYQYHLTVPVLYVLQKSISRQHIGFQPVVHILVMQFALIRLYMTSVLNIA